MSVGAVGILSGSGQAASITLTDDFNVAHDYKIEGVTGTIWSGILNVANAGILNANTAATGKLQFNNVSANLGWDASHANAPFLYLDIPAGDFTATIQVADFAWSENGSTNYASPTLMAYLDDNDFVSANINGFDGATTTFRTVDDGVQFQPEIGGPNVSGAGVAGRVAELRLDRVGDIFQAYGRKNADLPWIEMGTGITRADMNGELKVGLAYGTYSTNALTIANNYDNFSVTFVPESSALGLLSIGIAGILGRRRRN